MTTTKASPQKMRGASVAKASRGAYGRRTEAPGDDRSSQTAALADLEAEHVKLPNPWLGQLVRVFRHGQAAHQRTQAEKEAFRHDVEMLRSRLARAKPATAKGLALKEAFLRDFEGRDMPIDHVRAGMKPVPLLPAKVSTRGRPADWGVARMIDGAESDGWSWKVCAAAVFLSGADKRPYESIKKTFRDCARAQARR